MSTNNKKQIKINSDELNEMYKNINEKITFYLDENEQNMLKNELSIDEQNIEILFIKFATEEIKKKLSQIDDNFEQHSENEQTQQVKINMRELENIMKSEINKRIEN